MLHDGALTFAAESALPGSLTIFYRSRRIALSGQIARRNVMTRYMYGLPVELVGCGRLADVAAAIAEDMLDNRTCRCPRQNRSHSGSIRC